MVKLEEVEDEEFQTLKEEDENAFFTDTDSEISEDEGPDETASESIFDRIAALKDMIPPKQRSQLSNSISQASAVAMSGIKFSGKAMWVITTSVMLVGIPFGLALVDEQSIMDQEREQRAQQSATEVLTGGASFEERR